MGTEGNNNIPFISIIVPMYNCEKAIITCLNSIDYPEYEVIVVDDGSTDGGSKLVEEYAVGHPNVRLYHKQNGGVSSARNLGMKMANGRYLAFVDADDTLSPGGLSIVAKLVWETDADVAKYKINWRHSISENNCDVSSIPISFETILGKGKALTRYDISDYHVVDGLFKRSIISDNHLCFSENLHLHEDDVFMAAVYSNATNVIITDLPIYNYSIASEFSSTHNQSPERQRLLIHSGLLAIQQRKAMLQKFLPGEEFEYERLKYMRWVCRPKEAVAARYSYKQYMGILQLFREEGVYPLEYKWIQVANLDYSRFSVLKNAMRTFLINHPLLGLSFEHLRMLLR